MTDDIRRGLILGAVAVLSGCGGRLAESTPTRTPTDTPSPTPTPTPTSTPTPTPEPEPDAPEIHDINLVSEWEGFGDVYSNAVLSREAGDAITVAFRHLTWIHDGTYHVSEQMRVYDDSGARVDSWFYEDEQLVDGNGPDEWEHAAQFDTTGWDPGEYEAEVIIRDEVTSKVSDPYTETFTLD